MVFAENVFTGITFHWKEIETFAALLGAVLPEIRELHGTAVKELSCWTEQCTDPLI